MYNNYIHFGGVESGLLLRILRGNMLQGNEFPISTRGISVTPLVSLSFKTCPQPWIWSLSKALHIYKESHLRNSLRQLTSAAIKVLAFLVQRTHFV